MVRTLIGKHFIGCEILGITVFITNVPEGVRVLGIGGFENRNASNIEYTTEWFSNSSA